MALFVFFSSSTSAGRWGVTQALELSSVIKNTALIRPALIRVKWHGVKALSNSFSTLGFPILIALLELPQH